METEQKRKIGPVTLATGGAVAVAGLACWVLQQFFGITVPPLEQGYIGVILVMAAGWSVKPRRDGRHEA